MNSSLYLETTIPSFLVGTISPVLVTAAHQESTQQWWNQQRANYRLYVSSVVEDEILAGSREYAERRLALVADIPRLAVTPQVIRLAGELHDYVGLPRAAQIDAIHLALACHYGLDYLLTWNLKHLASARVRRRLAMWHDVRARVVPTICTPEELLERSDEP